MRCDQCKAALYPEDPTAAPLNQRTGKRMSPLCHCCCWYVEPEEPDFPFLLYENGMQPLPLKPLGVIQKETERLKGMTLWLMSKQSEAKGKAWYERG